MKTGSSGILGRQLIRRVILLSLIAIVALVFAIYVSLRAGLQKAQWQMEAAGFSAAQTFEQFLQGIQSDLSATSDALSSTRNADELLRHTLQRQFTIFELLLIDPQGTMIAQRRRAGVAGQVRFQKQPWLTAVRQRQIYIGPVDFQEFNVPFVDIALAVFDRANNFEATLLARVDLSSLWSVVIALRVGQHGYVYITDQAGHLLAYSDVNLLRQHLTLEDIVGHTPQAIAQSGLILHKGLKGDTVLAYSVPLKLVPWFAVIEQPAVEALRPFIIQALGMLFTLIVVFLIIFSITRFSRYKLVAPLLVLRQGVDLFRQGNLKHRIELPQKNELGTLATAFNTMAGALNRSIETLEDRVRERTRDLAASIEVSHRLSTILEQKKLVAEVVEQIRKAFDYYQVCICLFDKEGKSLTMASSSGGKQKKRATRQALTPPEKSIALQAATTNRVVLIPDVTQEQKGRFIPFSSEIKAELAVPIASGQQVLGALGVHHNVAGSIGQEDAELLQSLASQVAIALQNARLYEQAQQEIIQRRRFEEELKIYSVKLEQSNRELEEFAYVVSHDLQEPLRKVTAFGDRLETKYGEQLGEKGADYLYRMVDASKRMQNLINGLLNFSRVTTKANPFIPVDLNQVAREVISDLEYRIEQVNGRVEVRNLPEVEADPLQMRQLLQNLIGNALKFKHEEHPPLVTVRGQLLRNESDGSSEKVQIQVIDNGIGFEEKYAQRIFGVFQRLHGRGNYEGTGIGLSICKKIVQRHGGTIRAQSKPGKGTTFIIILPLKQANGEEAAPV